MCSLSCKCNLRRILLLSPTVGSAFYQGSVTVTAFLENRVFTGLSTLKIHFGVSVRVPICSSCLRYYILRDNNSPGSFRIKCNAPPDFGEADDNKISLLEYSRAAEPPVRCGVSHLSRRNEPL